MARFKLTLEYDGSKFKGWQFQKDLPTVMGKLMDACKEVFSADDFELYGSGRTDTGVHALYQVAHLDIKTSIPHHLIKIKLNDVLPAAINILNIENVHPNFHARYDAVARSYVYHISKRRTAFGKDYVWWIKDNLDIKAMADITPLFLGLKDYKSFGIQEKKGESTLVELISLKIYEIDDSILIHIVGSHFLWRMVRRIVGVLVEVGRGRMSDKDIIEFFREKSEVPSQFTAPPSGFYLERVYYKNDKIDEEPKWLVNIHQ